MNTLNELIKEYLLYCENQKQLDKKTLKAYKTDLKQFYEASETKFSIITSHSMIESYISCLHKKFKPRTVKRKIASIKAFYHYLEYREIIDLNPFNKIQIKFREPTLLPKTIPLHTIEKFIKTLYRQKETASTTYQKKCCCRDIAVIELLFATGMRISELCNLKLSDIDFTDRTILIFGKGSKERIIQIGNDDVMNAITNYYNIFQSEINACQFFFVNRYTNRLSEQSVRNMINKYCNIAHIPQHITPHMWRHSFATFLLEADVDIRYIQEMLGHSSISVTQIYTHVAMSKQKDILTTKHPRKNLHVRE